MHRPRRNPRSTRHSHRRRKRTSRRISRRRRLESIRTRLTGASLLAIVAGLAIACLCLFRIGPPPAIRIDALWVLDHKPLVEAAIWGLAAAGAGSVLLILLGRRRLALVAVWALAAALAVKFFSDRLLIIASVLLDQAS